MSLKRLPTDHTLTFPQLRLYINDLEQLHELLKQSGTSVEYQLSRFRCDSPADLLQVTDETGERSITELTIDASRPTGDRLLIELGKRSVRKGGSIYVFSQEASVIGLASQCHALLNSHRRSRLVRLLGDLRFLGLIAAVAGMIASTVMLFTMRTNPTLVPITTALTGGGAGGLAGLVLGVLYSIGYIRLFGTRIHLYRRSEDKPAFEWADIKGWIGNVVSALAGALALYALQKITGLTF